MKIGIELGVGAVLISCVATCASADVVAVGDPYDSGSWNQPFTTWNVPGGFDFLAVQIVSAGDSFESPVLAFSGPLGSGWQNLDTGSNPLVGVGSGPFINPTSQNQFIFDLHFAGSKGPVSFDIFNFAGDTLNEWAHATYNGSSWAFTYSNPASFAGTRDDFENAVVPLPTASALAGLGLLGISVRSRRNRL